MSHVRDSSPDRANASASSRASAQRGIRRNIQKKAIKATSHPTKVSWPLSAQKRKALLASGAVATLMVAVILPDRVSSEAIAQSDCQQVIQSGAEMSRGEISALIALPLKSPKQTVYQAVSEPYCTLPTETAAEKPEQSVTEREAYPLAFDPEVWMVLDYEAEKYVGYDFVFKP